jgi:Bacterial PH domain
MSAIEFDFEPQRGLPGALPAGERIVWQGAPDWRVLARRAFHVRKVAVYFTLLAGWGAATGGTLTGVIVTLGVGAVAVGLLAFLAWLSARSTVYTLTNRRLVLRYGAALTKCVNLPLKLVGKADVRLNPDGSGDLPLAMTDRMPFGWAMLWPHARPWRLRRPEPMLRAVPDAAAVAATLSQTLAEAVPAGRRSAIEVAPAPAYPLGETVAA